MNVLEKISEEIEEKIKVSDDCNEDLAFIDGIRYGLIEAKKIICSHMDEAENDGWIPVSERLPEKAGTYIVSAKDGKREIVTFVKWQNRFKKWDLSGARAYWKTNAWKPLPEPYKGEWY